MCGKDGVQRRVYKLKEEHESKGDRNRKKEKREKETETRKKKVRKERRNCASHERKTFIVPTLKP